MNTNNDKRQFKEYAIESSISFPILSSQVVSQSNTTSNPIRDLTFINSSNELNHTLYPFSQYQMPSQSYPFNPNLFDFNRNSNDINLIDSLVLQRQLNEQSPLFNNHYNQFSRNLVNENLLQPSYLGYSEAEQQKVIDKKKEEGKETSKKESVKQFRNKLDEITKCNDIFKKALGNLTATVDSIEKEVEVQKQLNEKSRTQLHLNNQSKYQNNWQQSTIQHLSSLLSNTPKKKKNNNSD